MRQQLGNLLSQSHVAFTCYFNLVYKEEQLTSHVQTILRYLIYPLAIFNEVIINAYC